MPFRTQQLQFLLNRLADVSLDDFKKEALSLIQNGADLHISSHMPPYRGGLHHLVLSNQAGVNDEAISELLRLKPDSVDVRDPNGWTALSVLINQAQSNQCSAEDFKRTAMLLARKGAELGVYASTAPYRTLLEHLVLSNQEGVNDEVITELLSLRSGNIDSREAYIKRALHSLLNQAQNNQCSADDFRRTLLLLAPNAADLNFYSNIIPHRTLVHHLVLTNQGGVNDTLIAELLDLKSANVDARDAYGCTALSSLINQVQSNQCTMEDFKRTAMLLARNGADLSVYGREAPYKTLLHHLVLSNQEGVNDAAITELLSFRSGNVNAKASHGCSALSALINQVQRNQCNAEDFKRMAMLLVANGADFRVCASEAPHRTLLHQLIFSNKEGAHDREITRLLELNPDFFSTRFHQGHLPLEALLYAEPNISVDAFMRIITLAGEKALFYKGAHQTTLLHVACRVGNLEIARYLVSKGLDLAAKTEQEDNLLHVSAQKHNNQAIWQWLYEQNIDLNAKNAANRTAIHLAAQSDNQAMLQWLFEHNAACYHTASDLSKLFTALKSEMLQERLYASIAKVKEYGQYLIDHGVFKGKSAVSLADALHKKAHSFFSQDATTINFPQFKKEFSALLKSRDKEMSEYRISWSTIIRNVLEALTGFGVIPMLVHLMQSKTTTGRYLFFGQKPRTSSEEKLDEVESVLNEIEISDRNIAS